MSGVDCMSCLVNLARGCPSSGGTMMHGRVVCARVRAATTGSRWRAGELPAHLFAWNYVAERWIFFKGTKFCWATREL